MSIPSIDPSEITGPRAYIVMGEAGEYSQYDAWPEMVCLEEQAAHQEAARLKSAATASYGDYQGSEKPVYSVVVVPLFTPSQSGAEIAGKGNGPKGLCANLSDQR